MGTPNPSGAWQHPVPIALRGRPASSNRTPGSKRPPQRQRDADVVFQFARGRRAVVVRVIQAAGNVEVAPQFAAYGGVQVQQKSTGFAEPEAKVIGDVEIRLRILVEEQRVVRRGERQDVRTRRIIEWHLLNQNRPPSTVSSCRWLFRIR